MIEFRTKLKDVFVGIYLNGDKGNIVLAPGMPQYLDKYHPFVEQAAKLGYNLFVPRYMGTFESDGEFSSENSKKTLEETIKMVKNGKIKELFAGSELTWNISPIYLLGFSYGALPALLQTEVVQKTVLICPFVSMKYHTKGASGEDVYDTYCFLERAYPNLYRLNPSNVIEDLTKVSLPKVKENLYLVKGTKDKSIPAEEIHFLQKEYNAPLVEKETGHSISLSDELLLKVLNA